MSQTGGSPMGRYLLGELLARGGMGEVYLAAQLGAARFEKALALKILLPHLGEDPKCVEMFLSEARLAAQMNHPNVVQIFDAGLCEGRYFIAMERVRGAPMSRIIEALTRADRQVPAAVLLHVARATCAGLHHAHELLDPEGRPLDLVHRDVTPHNVLLGVAGEVKLADFGIAKVRGSTFGTRTGTLKGKLGYVSPEQVAGLQVDRRTDLFGLSVTLFHLATRQSPFLRDSEAATLRAIERDPLPDLRALRPDLPEAFAEALARGASKDPQARFSTANELRDAVPLPEASDAADRLGALIHELCPEVIRKIDVQGSLVERGAATASVGHPPARGRGSERTAASTTKRRIVLGAVGLGTLVTAAIAYSGWGPPGAGAPAPKARSALPSSPPVSEEPPAAEAVQPRPRVVRSGKGEARAPGYLNLDATPWARVEIEGRAVGETPIARFPVPEGTVSVHFTNPESGRSQTQTVRVVAGKQRSLRADLR